MHVCAKCNSNTVPQSDVLFSSPSLLVEVKFLDLQCLECYLDPYLFNICTDKSRIQFTWEFVTINVETLWAFKIDQYQL